MAIYRPTKPRWRLALATGVLGLAVGLIAGLAFGRDDPDALESARVIQTELVSAAGSLEVAAVEYEEAVEGREVVKQAEYEGALAAFESSRTKYAEIRPALEVLALPFEVEYIDDQYAGVERLMQDVRGEETVTSMLANLRNSLVPDVSHKGSPR